MRVTRLRLQAAARRVASGGVALRWRRRLWVVAVVCIVIVVVAIAIAIAIAGRRRGVPGGRSRRRLHKSAVTKVRAAALAEADRPAAISDLHDDAPPSPALRRRVQGHDLVAQVERPPQGACMLVHLCSLPLSFLPASLKSFHAAVRSGRRRARAWDGGSGLPVEHPFGG